MGTNMDEEKQAWKFTQEILKDPSKTDSTVIALAAKIEQITTGLKNLATLNRLGVNFNNVTSVKTLANEIMLMTPPADDNGLRLMKKNMGAISTKAYVLAMVKNQFVTIINDATADCPSLQTIAHNLSQQLGESNQTIACAMLTSYSDLIEIGRAHV